MKKLKTPKGSTPVILSIVLGIISSAIYDLIKSRPFLSTLLSILRKLYAYLVQLFTLEIKFWVLILMVAVLAIIRKIWISLQESGGKNEPDYVQYKSDIFKVWLWKWEWKYSYNTRSWNVIDLCPYCPKCDIVLVNRSNITGQIAVCPKCGTKYDDYNGIEDSEFALKLIEHNAKKNTYSKNLNQKG